MTVAVTVQVEQATDEMVQNAVTLRFQDLSPEDFVGLHMKDLKKVLRDRLVGDTAGVAVGPDPLHILGVQPLSRSGQLEVLLAVEAPEGGYIGPGELALKLDEVRGVLGGTSRVVGIQDQSCSGELECGERVCELTLSLDPIGLVTYTTSRVSLVSPRFSRKESCICPGLHSTAGRNTLFIQDDSIQTVAWNFNFLLTLTGGICPSSLELCDGQTCPLDMQCVRSGPTAPSLCQCLPDTLDQCAGYTSLETSGYRDS